MKLCFLEQMDKSHVYNLLLQPNYEAINKRQKDQYHSRTKLASAFTWEKGILASSFCIQLIFGISPSSIPPSHQRMWTQLVKRSQNLKPGLPLSRWALSTTVQSDKIRHLLGGCNPAWKADWDCLMSDPFGKTRKKMPSTVGQHIQ